MIVSEFIEWLKTMPQDAVVEVLDLVGLSKIEYAYRLCKSKTIKSTADMQRVLEDLKEQLEEFEQ